MLGFNSSSFDDKNITPEQKKFDNKFIIGVAFLAFVAVVLVVADLNYLHVGYLVPIGFVVIGIGIVANLIKGYIDWRRKKAREASGEIEKKQPKTDVEAAAASVSSLKPPKKNRSRKITAKDFSAAALASEIEDERPLEDQKEAALEPILAINFAPADPLLTDFGITTPTEDK